MSVFLLPKIVIKAIEKLCCSYLWSSGVDLVQGSKVSWRLICQPKMKGGLGIKDLTVCSKAAIVRQTWLLFSESDSLWIA